MPNVTAAVRRERARAHHEQVEARANRITMQTLANKWGCSIEAVRAIPREKLPYVVIGNGPQREHRRYLPAAVAAYEAGREAGR